MNTLEFLSSKKIKQKEKYRIIEIKVSDIPEGTDYLLIEY